VRHQLRNNNNNNNTTILAADRKYFSVSHTVTMSILMQLTVWKDASLK